MGKLFGTDGIRGVANETLDAKLAYRIGQAAAISLSDDSGTKPTVVIGKDTRISSDMLEGALVAGLTACGCNAILHRSATTASSPRKRRITRWESSRSTSWGWTPSTGGC